MEAKGEWKGPVGGSYTGGLPVRGWHTGSFPLRGGHTGGSGARGEKGGHQRPAPWRLGSAFQLSHGGLEPERTDPETPRPGFVP